MFRLTNVIPERISFISWGITVLQLQKYEYINSTLNHQKYFVGTSPSHTYENSTAFYNTSTLGDPSYSTPMPSFMFSRIPIQFWTIIYWSLAFTSIQEAVWGHIWYFIWIYICYCHQRMQFPLIRNLSFLCFWINMSCTASATLFAASTVQ